MGFRLTIDLPVFCQRQRALVRHFDDLIMLPVVPATVVDIPVPDSIDREVEMAGIGGFMDFYAIQIDCAVGVTTEGGKNNEGSDERKPEFREVKFFHGRQNWRQI